MDANPVLVSDFAFRSDFFALIFCACMLLLGQPIADKILAETKSLVERSGIVPGLGIVLVGGDEASLLYVSLKERRAREIGIDVVREALPETATEADVLDAVRTFNADPRIHGIIVQLPLPGQVDADRVIGAIDPAKDADGFIAGTPVFPEAIVEIAKSAAGTLAGKRGMIFANSERFGETMRRVLEQEGAVAEYSVGEATFHEGGIDADIVVTALGRPGLFRGEMFKKGAIVIDGGIAKQDGMVAGDVSLEGMPENISLSPVPGGVGPVTVACLLRRVADLAIRKTAL